LIEAVRAAGLRTILDDLQRALPGPHPRFLRLQVNPHLKHNFGIDKRFTY
jgi:hypothetical protein